MKNICVFCSANDLAEKYTRPAIEFSRSIPRHGYDLVWGGSNTGLMEVVASTVQEAGGKIFGISVEHLKEVQRENADEMLVAQTLAERKSLMLGKSDAFVVMVGGIGTLDEVTEIIELKKHKIHEKPIVFLNTDNFYEGIKVQLQKMKDEGFINEKLDDILYFADYPKEAMNYLHTALNHG